MWSYENIFVFYQSFNILGYFTRVISVSDLKRVGLVSKHEMTSHTEDLATLESKSDDSLLVWVLLMLFSHECS